MGTLSNEFLLPFDTENIIFVDRFCVLPWFQTFLDKTVFKIENRTQIIHNLIRKESMPLHGKTTSKHMCMLLHVICLDFS